MHEYINQNDKLAYWQNYLVSLETRCLTDDVILHGGHRLISSLKEPASSGVAILVHQKHIKHVKSKTLISDRIMAIDMRIGRKELRIIVVYIPHTGYEWDYIESTMREVSELVLNTSLSIGDRGRFLDDLCREFELIITNNER